MSTRQTRYDEDFKRTLVDLYYNGKTQSALCKEYGVSLTALSRWIKHIVGQFSRQNICHFIMNLC